MILLSDLCCGLQLMHNRVPVQLLCLVSQRPGSACWSVRPLFVVGVDRDEVFLPGDRMSYLHGCVKRAGAH